MEKKNNAFSLIDEAAFLKVTLIDLRITINRDGTETTYQNGENQWGTKKSPAFDNYLNANKQFMAIMKQLNDLLPKEMTSKSNEKDDGFDGFVGGRDD